LRKANATAAVRHHDFCRGRRSEDFHPAIGRVDFVAAAFAAGQIHADVPAEFAVAAANAEPKVAFEGLPVAVKFRAAEHFAV